MKNGERIRLIQTTADSLAGRLVPEVQLILKQFGLRTYDFEDSFKATELLEYCYAQVGELSNELLIELHEFAMGDDAAPTAAPGDVWADRPIRVFLSHVHEDREFVGRVKGLLEEKFWIAAFVAHDDIYPSKQWRAVIRRALGSCDALAGIMANRFHSSQWCDQEVGWALGRRVPVLMVQPRHFDSSKALDGFLEESQALLMDKMRPGREDFDVARGIFDMVLRDSNLHSRARSCLIEAFVNSPSFDFTRDIWKRIEAEPSLEPDHLRRLEYAVQTNRQVYDANSDTGRAISENVKVLVDRFEPPTAAIFGDDEPF